MPKVKKQKEQGKEEKKQDVHLDFGLGKLSLGGLFDGIEKLIDLAGEVKEAGGEIRKEGEIDLSHLSTTKQGGSADLFGGKEGMKGVFGFSVKTAVGGKPVVERFGNIKKTPKGPVVEEIREPMTDVFDEKEGMKVYAEMPGVNREDIKLDLKEDILDISAQTGEKKYHKEVLLPAKVKKETLESSYRNGILEVKIKKC